MFRVFLSLSWTVFAVSMFACSCFGSEKTDRSAKSAPLEIQVHKILAELGYVPGELLTTEQVELVLAKLPEDGFAIGAVDPILERTVPADSVLRLEFKTARGQRFLRQIGQIRGGYSYLEQIAKLPQGKQLLRQLQSDPGGDKLIQYLSTTRSGHRLGSMTAKGPNGVNLNRPTNRIYTAEDLIAALHEGKQTGKSNSQVQP